VSAAGTATDDNDSTHTKNERKSFLKRTLHRENFVENPKRSISFWGGFESPKIPFLKFIKNGKKLVEIVLFLKKRERESKEILSISLFFFDITISTKFSPCLTNFKTPNRAPTHNYFAELNTKLFSTPLLAYRQ
jgi:hypothetical protein